MLASPDPLVFVRGLLSQESVSMTKVARETGLSKKWLEMIRAGSIENPGIRNLQMVARYFGHEICHVSLPKLISDKLA